MRYDDHTACEVRRQTDFQKNACGCVLFILLSPFLLALLAYLLQYV